jgi:hypothetical protein
MEGYCVKCKKKKTMSGAKTVKTASGRTMVQGVCGTCGTKMSVFTK